MIEPLSTERNWCGSIVSGVDGSAMVSAGLRAWALASPGVRAAAATAAPALLSRSRRVCIRSLLLGAPHAGKPATVMAVFTEFAMKHCACASWWSFASSSCDGCFSPP